MISKRHQLWPTCHVGKHHLLWQWFSGTQRIPISSKHLYLYVLLNDLTTPFYLKMSFTWRKKHKTTSRQVVGKKISKSLTAKSWNKLEDLNIPFQIWDARTAANLFQRQICQLCQFGVGVDGSFVNLLYFSRVSHHHTVQLMGEYDITS